ncbi:MAG TPA: MMPL family transporter [Pirellulaceae bacterium]|jgi:RND superfamily putative drug exporter|nr:MMPL family transporter [Pirellulaceae bacterium]
MFRRLGEFVARYPWLVVGAWVALAVGVWFAAPNWDAVAHDSDFDSLPEGLPSTKGEALLRQAFPGDRGRSSIALVFHRHGKELTAQDIYLIQDATADFLAGLGDRGFPAQNSKARGAAEASAPDSAIAYEDAVAAYRDAIAALDGVIDQLADRPAQTAWEEDAVARRATLFRKLATLHRIAGNEEARRDIAIEARALGIDLKKETPLERAAWAEKWELADVWSPAHSLYGSKLVSPKGDARLIVLQLSREFAATRNIELLDELEAFLGNLRSRAKERTEPGLDVAYTGTAAIGGEMLRSAAASIRQTELITIVMVIGFLAMIYRSPTLILAPLLTLGIALVVALATIAAVAAVWAVTLDSIFEYRIYATTRIFVVVILLGAGTDYCLFLIARYREAMQTSPTRREALVSAMGGVGGALVASAMTTILGLSTMLFSEFGKIASSGPTIAVSLAIGLFACLTLTPALLAILGPLAFWNGLPRNLSRARLAQAEERTRLPTGDGFSERFWGRVADAVLKRPALILFAAVAVFAPAFWNGLSQGDKTSYDITSQIDPSRPARQGLRIVERYFPVGRSSPITVIVKNSDADFLSPDGRRELERLASQLYGPGVATVYSLADPMGQKSTEEGSDAESSGGSSLFSASAWRRWTMRSHRLAEKAYVSGTQPGGHDVTRFEVILALPPTSNEAIGTLGEMESRLQALTRQEGSFWDDATFAFAGATASLRDLKEVTRSDTFRIQILTVLAVYAVLFFLLWRPVVSAYMILSVLWSFFVTLGMTDWFFAWRYGDTYDGLDWKLPLFLFVILVAVGEDYNVYLAARVEEERKLRGSREGLRAAMIRTGGIVTSCGIIMAATFFSMTAADWLPTLVHIFPSLVKRFPELSSGLRSVTQMGFALSLGILIDTLLVRTVLLPAFLAIWDGRKESASASAGPGGT